MSEGSRERECARKTASSTSKQVGGRQAHRQHSTCPSPVGSFSFFMLAERNKELRSVREACVSHPGRCLSPSFMQVERACLLPGRKCLRDR